MSELFSSRIKNAFVGMLASVIASFMFSVLVWAAIAGPPNRIRALELDAYFVLITLWFVLPMGAVLGLYLPQRLAPLDRKAGIRVGFRWGAISGPVCGVLLGIQLSIILESIEMLPWWSVLFGITMAIYSGSCVGLVALRYLKKATA